MPKRHRLVAGILYAQENDTLGSVPNHVFPLPSHPSSPPPPPVLESVPIPTKACALSRNCKLVNHGIPRPSSHALPLSRLENHFYLDGSVTVRAPSDYPA